MAINNSLLIHQFKRKDYSYNASDYLTSSGTYDRGKLMADARKLAKSMNQRLLRLERAGMTNSPAYQGAVKALSGYYDKSGSVPFGHVDKAGRPRYKENVKNLSTEDLRRLLYAAGKTSQAKTSTVGTVRKIYAKGAKNLQKMIKDLGLNMSENALMALMKNQALGQLTKTYGYKAVVQAVSDAMTELDVQELQRDEAYQIEQLSQMVTDYVEKFGSAPDNVLQLRKLFGLETPVLKPGGKWKHSV